MICIDVRAVDGRQCLVCHPACCPSSITITQTHNPQRVLPDHLAEAEEVARAQEPPTTPTGLLEAMRAVLKVR